MQSLWMLLAALLFALMGLLVKLVSAEVPVSQAVFFRGVVAALILGGWMAWRRLAFGTPHVRLQVQRTASGVAALTLFFYAISVLPLATATTLNYTSPLFVALFTVLAALAAGRRDLPWALLACIVAGFAGIVLLLRPVFSGGESMAALLGLLSGLLSALAYWNIRALGKLGEPEWRTVFYHSAVTALVGLTGMALFGMVWPSARAWAMLLAIGVMALGAQLAMTRAFSRGKTLLTSSLQYSVVVFSTLLGVWIAGDSLGATALTGIGIVLAAGVVATLVTIRAAATVAPAPDAASSPRASLPTKETMNVSNAD
jgi:S-adenosylmethionine uptake transporter